MPKTANKCAQKRKQSVRAKKQRLKTSIPKPAAKTASKGKGSDARKRTHRKLVKMEEALREEGIDERKIAQGYASMHGTLGDSDDKGDLKLFFDVLKENARVLEPPRPPDRSGACDGPVTVILKHNVPRPAR